MSVLIDALRPHILPELLHIQGDVDQTLDELIGAKGAFYPSYDPTTPAWLLNFGVSDRVALFYANECSRFASASFQTYRTVSREFETAENVPWAIVRAYYAAFYAGHSILRIIGSSCTYIDGSRLATLRQILALYGLVDTFQGGMYEATIERSAAEIRFQLLGSNFGGTHEQFWHVFNKRLAQMEAQILQGNLPQLQAQQAWDCLGNFRSIISSRGTSSPSWLSNVRNAVQYRHTYGVWFPFKLIKSERLTLSRVAGRWNGDPLAVPLSIGTCGDLGPFIAGCTFLVSFCRSLIALIAQLGKRGSAESFVHYGPQRYLNTLDRAARN
jgi:hypothetical protein